MIKCRKLLQWQYLQFTYIVCTKDRQWRSNTKLPSESRP